MLNDPKTCLFLFLQSGKETDRKIAVGDSEKDLERLANKNISCLVHTSVWMVKRSSCPVVRFRTELAAKVFASGYALELAEGIDGIPECKQKSIFKKIKSAKLTEFRLSWLSEKESPVQQKVLSGKFK